MSIIIQEKEGKLPPKQGKCVGDGKNTGNYGSAAALVSAEGLTGLSS